MEVHLDELLEETNERFPHWEIPELEIVQWDKHMLSEDGHVGCVCFDEND